MPVKAAIVSVLGCFGTAVRLAGVPRAGASRRFDDPVAVTADTLGTIYVAEAGSRQVRAILSDGRLVLIAPAGTFEEPLGLAVLENGVLAVADGSTQSSVVRFGGAPVIDSVDPPEAPFLGGQVTIVGRNFAPESRVFLAGTEIDRADVTVRDSTVAGGSTFSGDGSPAESRRRRNLRVVDELPDQVGFEIEPNLRTGCFKTRQRRGRRRKRRASVGARARNAKPIGSSPPSARL